MGYKASMIIINKPSATINEEELLQNLGFSRVRFLATTTFDECMYPNDKSINLGYYNNCLIISDDYQLTTFLELSQNPGLLSEYEKVLTALYPGAEILTVACHSAVNYHLYSLAKDGHKLRFKKVVHGEQLVEYGDRIEEEEKIYADSGVIDGQRMFRSTYTDDKVYEYSEDQMMEDFSFGVAKRHLGVMISTDEDDELTYEIPFRKYGVSEAKEKNSQHSSDGKKQAKVSWLMRLMKKL